MKKSSLAPWQIILIVAGLLLIFGPSVWDFLSSTFTFLAEINLQDIFTRSGMALIGAILLIIVGGYELAKDWRDEPESKHIK